VYGRRPLAKSELLRPDDIVLFGIGIEVTEKDLFEDFGEVREESDGTAIARDAGIFAGFRDQSYFSYFPGIGIIG
jgi:hypothetical protein